MSSAVWQLHNIQCLKFKIQIEDIFKTERCYVTISKPTEQLTNINIYIKYKYTYHLFADLPNSAAAHSLDRSPGSSPGENICMYPFTIKNKK